MNLMFWKRKTGAAEDAENARENPAVSTKQHESLDFSDAQQAIAGHDPEPSDPKSTDSEEDSRENPKKPGLLARIRSRLGTLTGHFRKAPAFRAGEDPAPDVSDNTEEPDGVVDREAGPEPEEPYKPELGERIKMKFISLIRRFRKTPARDAEEGGAGEADESRAHETPARPGLLMRVGAGLAAFTREIKAPAAPAAEAADQDAGPRSRPDATDEGELPLPEEEATAEPVRSRKWLVIGGSIGILILLLVHIAMANWPIFKEPKKRWGTRHDQRDLSSSPRRPESGYEASPAYAPEGSPAEIEALKKKNAELQARIDALKEQQPQQRSYALPADGASAPSFSTSGELTLDGNSPKAAAMTLKEAIEAMNAGSGDYKKKPAK